MTDWNNILGTPYLHVDEKEKIYGCVKEETNPLVILRHCGISICAIALLPAVTYDSINSTGVLANHLKMVFLAIISCEMVSIIVYSYGASLSYDRSIVGNAHAVPEVQELGRFLLDPVDKLSVQSVGMIDQSWPIPQQHQLGGTIETLQEIGHHAWDVLSHFALIWTRERGRTSICWRKILSR